MQNNSPMIESTDFSIGNLLKHFFTVPDYQREFVWKQEQVLSLLDDVEDAWLSKTDTSDYFIGSMVVCPGDDARLQLIDGQQRMTTIYVILCALRDFIAENPPSDIQKSIEELLLGRQVLDDGTATAQHRVLLQYEESRRLLETMGEREGYQTRHFEHPTPSMENIDGAYETATNFLSARFPNDKNKAARFYSYFVNHVKIILITTQNVSRALKVFETINDRGVGLNSMDLLKNLIFMNAPRDQFEKIKTEWRTMIENLDKEDPSLFLRYFLYANYDVSPADVRGGRIYEWFSGKDDVCGCRSNPLDFVYKLQNSSLDFKSLLEYKRKGRPATFSPLENLSLFFGGRMRRHLIILMAGMHLNDALFLRLAEEVEALFFCYSLVNQNGTTIETSFGSWAKKLRQVKHNDEKTFSLFIAENFEKARGAMAESFSIEFSRMGLKTLTKQKIKYVLAKIFDHCDLKPKKGKESIKKWFEHEIEHILPSNANQEALREFGHKSDKDLHDLLGNLLLIEKPINASLKNLPFSKKSAKYAKSDFRLVRHFATSQGIGQTQIDKTLTGLVSYTDWNEKNLRARQQTLVAIAKIIWKIPAPSFVVDEPL